MPAAPGGTADSPADHGTQEYAEAQHLPAHDPTGPEQPAPPGTHGTAQHTEEYLGTEEYGDTGEYPDTDEYHEAAVLPAGAEARFFPWGRQATPADNPPPFDRLRSSPTRPED